MSAETKTEPEVLVHVWGEKIEDFFARIDRCGGWPLDKKHVAFYHGTKRECEFTDHPVRNEWWTTVASSDDYYWWKLSEERKNKFRAEVTQEIGWGLVRRGEK